MQLGCASAAISFVCLLCHPQLLAQKLPAFEVASVRVSQDTSPMPRVSTDPSGIHWHNVTLRFLVQYAYEIKDYTLTAPGWLADARYDVEATLPAGSTLAQSSAMLQSLLTDRFKISVHHEEKLMPVLELHIGKDQSKLHTSDTQMHLGWGSAGRHLTGGLTMARLADIISRDLDRPLLDRTGLNGKFDVDLTWRPDRTRGPKPSPSDDLDHPTVFSELREKLGLTVSSGKAPIDTVTVDHVERIPTEN